MLNNEQIGLVGGIWTTAKIHEVGLRPVLMLDAEAWGKLIPYVFGGYSGATLLSIVNLAFPPSSYS
eukprot:6401314-Pyramimonas_sp.AAC.1